MTWPFWFKRGKTTGLETRAQLRIFTGEPDRAWKLEGAVFRMAPRLQ